MSTSSANWDGSGFEKEPFDDDLDDPSAGGLLTTFDDEWPAMARHYLPTAHGIASVPTGRGSDSHRPHPRVQHPPRNMYEPRTQEQITRREQIATAVEITLFVMAAGIVSTIMIFGPR